MHVCMSDADPAESVAVPSGTIPEIVITPDIEPVLFSNAASLSVGDVCDVCAFEHTPAESHLCTPAAAPLPIPPSIPVELLDSLPVGAVTAVTDAVPFYIHCAGTSLFAPGKLSTDGCTSVVSCLVDTGAAITLVNFAVVQKLQAEHLLRPASELAVSALYTAGGGTLDMKGCLPLRFQFGHISFSARVLAVAGLTEECLLGADILAAHGFSLHLDGSQRLTLAEHTVPLSRGRGDIVPVHSARFGGDVQSTLW